MHKSVDLSSKEAYEIGPGGIPVVEIWDGPIESELENDSKWLNMDLKAWHTLKSY